jgi:hypothetical protein
MIYSNAYDEIIDFIATGTSPEEVIAFRPSEKMQAQVSSLINKEKNGSLTEAEKMELDKHSFIEHLMRSAKARAYQLLAQK